MTISILRVPTRRGGWKCRPEGRHWLRGHLRGIWVFVFDERTGDFELHGTEMVIVVFHTSVPLQVAPCPFQTGGVTGLRDAGGQVEGYGTDAHIQRVAVAAEGGVLLEDEPG